MLRELMEIEKYRKLDPEIKRKNIEGYKELYENASDEDCIAFFEIKHKSLEGKCDYKFTSNLDLVDWMKENGRWNGRKTS